MLTIKTAHSTYTVDTDNKTVTGGYFGNEVKEYREMGYLLGYPAFFLLKDGSPILTTKITQVA